MNSISILLTIFTLVHCKANDQAMLTGNSDQSSVSVGAGDEQVIATLRSGDTPEVIENYPENSLPTFHPEPTQEPQTSQDPAESGGDQFIAKECVYQAKPLEPFTSYGDSCQEYRKELVVMNSNILRFAGEDKLCCQTDSDCVRKTILAPSAFGAGCAANMNETWWQRWEEQKAHYQNRIDVLYEKAENKNCPVFAVLCLKPNQELRCELGQCVR